MHGVNEPLAPSTGPLEPSIWGAVGSGEVTWTPWSESIWGQCHLHNPGQAGMGCRWQAASCASLSLQAPGVPAPMEEGAYFHGRGAAAAPGRPLPHRRAAGEEKDAAHGGRCRTLWQVGLGAWPFLLPIQPCLMGLMQVSGHTRQASTDPPDQP